MYYYPHHVKVRSEAAAKAEDAATRAVAERAEALRRLRLAHDVEMRKAGRDILRLEREARRHQQHQEQVGGWGRWGVSRSLVSFSLFTLVFFVFFICRPVLISTFLLFLLSCSALSCRVDGFAQLSISYLFHRIRLLLTTTNDPPTTLFYVSTLSLLLASLKGGR